EVASAGVYTIGEGVSLGDRTAPYRRQSCDPVYRPLRIFTRDPATSILEGAVALVNLPFEPLSPGPESAFFSVEGPDEPLDLNKPSILIGNGLAPSMSDPQFRKQMVYAVCTTVYA